MTLVAEEMWVQISPANNYNVSYMETEIVSGKCKLEKETTTGSRLSLTREDILLQHIGKTA